MVRDPSTKLCGEQLNSVFTIGAWYEIQRFARSGGVATGRLDGVSFFREIGGK